MVSEPLFAASTAVANISPIPGNSRFSTDRYIPRNLPLFNKWGGAAVLKTNCSEDQTRNISTQHTDSIYEK